MFFFGCAKIKGCAKIRGSFVFSLILDSEALHINCISKIHREDIMKLEKVSERGKLTDQRGSIYKIQPSLREKARFEHKSSKNGKSILTKNFV